MFERLNHILPFALELCRFLRNYYGNEIDVLSLGVVPEKDP